MNILFKELLYLKTKGKCFEIIKIDIDIYAITDGRLNSQYRMNFDKKRLNIRRDIVIPIH